MAPPRVRLRMAWVESTGSERWQASITSASVTFSHLQICRGASVQATHDESTAGARRARTTFCLGSLTVPFGPSCARAGAQTGGRSVPISVTMHRPAARGTLRPFMPLLGTTIGARSGLNFRFGLVTGAPVKQGAAG